MVAIRRKVLYEPDTFGYSVIEVIRRQEGSFYGEGSGESEGRNEDREREVLEERPLHCGGREKRRRRQRGRGTRRLWALKLTGFMMETFTNPHFPKSLSIAHVALYASVNNAKDLRSRIIKASTLEGDEGEQERQAVNFAFIDARLVGRFWLCYLCLADEREDYKQAAPPDRHIPGCHGRSSGRTANEDSPFGDYLDIEPDK